MASSFKVILNKQATMIGSISLQERLQMKREPLDQWSTREKLCLATAVMRSGDQNWMSVSRTLKPFGEPNRPADWFHQKNCAAQYGALLEQIETPKRKKRSSFGGVQEPLQLETPAESILKNLQAQRQEELKQLLAEEKKEYLQLQEDMKQLQSGQVSEEQLDEWCMAIEEEERQKDLENAEHAAWLKEREQRKQELERVWRPVIGQQQMGVIGQKRKASEESTLEPINTSAHLKVDNSDETKKSPVITSPEVPTKPALSPLLTSLLKSPSSHQQQPTVPQHASILHSAITTPKIGSTTINPTIASLLNRSASVTVSPGIQQLVTSAISSAEPTPITSPINIHSRISQPPNQLATSVSDLLSDSEVPNLKDIEKTISIDHPLPEMKNEEVDTIISDLIDNNDIVSDPEKHLLDVNDDDIINSLENELEELANEEKAAIAYAAAKIVDNVPEVTSMTESTDQVMEAVPVTEETSNTSKVVELQPIVVLTSPSPKVWSDTEDKVKEEAIEDKVIESAVKEALPEKSPETEVVETKEEKAKIEIDPFEFQEDPEIQPSKPSAGLKLVSQQSLNQLDSKTSIENILNDLQTSKKDTFLRHSTETRELRKSITEMLKPEQKEIEEEPIVSAGGSVEIVEIDVLEDEDSSNDSYKSKTSEASSTKLVASEIVKSKPEILAIVEETSPVSETVSPTKVETPSTTVATEEEQTIKPIIVESKADIKVDDVKVDNSTDNPNNKDDSNVQDDAEEDQVVVALAPSSVNKIEAIIEVKVKEEVEIKREDVRTFTPDYSNSVGDMFDDLNTATQMKVCKVKRDYSRTKKKEDSTDIDLLLAVEKAASETLHDHDDDIDDGEEHTSTTASSKASVSSKTTKLPKEHCTDESEEDNSTAAATSTSTHLPRSTRRRYSTPATPVDSIPSSPASSFDDDRDYRNWKKAVLLVHGRLAMHRYASLFMKGVTNDQAPSYHDLIYRPMDLQTIRKNVDSGVIRTNGEFKRDVLLMLANAIMYNDVGSQIYDMAMEMRKEAHEQLQILYQAQQAGDAGPSRRETRTTELQQQQQQQQQMQVVVANKRKRVSETEASRVVKKRRED